MREVVQFLSDSKVYFDFSSRLLYLEDGASISLPERQSNLLYLFASKPNTVITSRQIARSELVESPVPDNYHESNSSDSDNIIAGKLMSDIRKRVPILKTLIKVETRFGYVYSGNQLMNVSDDWRPDSESIVKTDSYEPSADPILSIVDTAVSFPYEGNQPFVFISYAHKNSNEVMGILNGLKECGLRVWYDEGIEWGSEWPQSIAEHLKKCSLFLAFHSKDSIVSANCRQEVAYAIKNKKTILSVYLEDVLLPDGMDMQLSIYQAIKKQNGETNDNFVARLLGYQLLKDCINMQKYLDSMDFKDRSIVSRKRSPRPLVYALIASMVIGILVLMIIPYFREQLLFGIHLWIPSVIGVVIITTGLSLFLSEKYETSSNAEKYYLSVMVPLLFPMIAEMLLPSLLYVFLFVVGIILVFVIIRTMFW